MILPWVLNPGFSAGGPQRNDQVQSKVQPMQSPHTVCGHWNLQLFFNRTWWLLLWIYPLKVHFQTKMTPFKYVVMCSHHPQQKLSPGKTGQVQNISDSQPRCWGERAAIPNQVSLSLEQTLQTCCLIILSVMGCGASLNSTEINFFLKQLI